MRVKLMFVALHRETGRFSKSRASEAKLRSHPRSGLATLPYGTLTLLVVAQLLIVYLIPSSTYVCCSPFDIAGQVHRGTR
jgi:hypothetical protein